MLFTQFSNKTGIFCYITETRLPEFSIQCFPHSALKITRKNMENKSRRLARNQHSLLKREDGFGWENANPLCLFGGLVDLISRTDARGTHKRKENPHKCLASSGIKLNI